MAGLLSICGPEVRQKDFLIKRCVRIPIFGEERSMLTTGNIREEAVSIVLYKCSRVTTLGCFSGFTVSTEAPQHHGAGCCVDTATFAPNLSRFKEYY